MDLFFVGHLTVSVAPIVAAGCTAAMRSPADLADIKTGHVSIPDPRSTNLEESETIGITLGKCSQCEHDISTLFSVHVAVLTLSLHG